MTSERFFDHDGCVVGSLHQGSQNFSVGSRGLQCVPMAICSLLKSTEIQPKYWRTSVIDSILQAGNFIYTSIGKSGTLLPTDVPRYIHLHSINNNWIKISHRSFTHGCEEFNIKTFDSLSNLFTYYTHMLLCIGDSTVAIMHMDHGKYYIFDSHSRYIEGYPTPNGRAVLLSFNFLKELYNYLRKLAMVLNADKFELTPIQITRYFSHNKMDHYSVYENTTITHLKPGRTFHYWGSWHENTKNLIAFRIKEHFKITCWTKWSKRQKKKETHHS